MEQQGFCCGQVPRRKDFTESNSLPENPEISDGTEVIYLGAGELKITGSKSGLVYYLSDHRRRFMADKEDLPAILKMPDLILKP